MFFVSSVSSAPGGTLPEETRSIVEPQLAISLGGDITAVWRVSVDRTYSGQAIGEEHDIRILMSRKPSGGTWQPAVELDRSNYQNARLAGDEILGATFAVDGSGRVGIAWTKDDFGSAPASLKTKWFNSDGTTLLETAAIPLVSAWNSPQLAANADTSFRLAGGAAGRNPDATLRNGGRSFR